MAKAKAPLACPECEVSWVGDVIPEVERPDWEGMCHWPRVYRTPMPVVDKKGRQEIGDDDVPVTVPGVQCPGCNCMFERDKWSWDKWSCGESDALPDVRAVPDDDIPKGMPYKPGSGEHPDPLAWARGEVGRKTKHDDETTPA